MLNAKAHLTSLQPVGCDCLRDTRGLYVSLGIAKIDRRVSSSEVRANEDIDGIIPSKILFSTGEFFTRNIFRRYVAKESDGIKEKEREI